MDVPTNACSISPLMNNKSSPKYHVLLAGGVSARIAATTKVIISSIIFKKIRKVDLNCIYGMLC